MVRIRRFGIVHTATMVAALYAFIALIFFAFFALLALLGRSSARPRRPTGRPRRLGAASSGS